MDTSLFMLFGIFICGLIIAAMALIVDWWERH
jgi:hypothetical protein